MRLWGGMRQKLAWKLCAPVSTAAVPGLTDEETTIVAPKVAWPEILGVCEELGEVCLDSLDVERLNSLYVHSLGGALLRQQVHGHVAAFTFVVVRYRVGWGPNEGAKCTVQFDCHEAPAAVIWQPGPPGWQAHRPSCPGKGIPQE